MSENPISNIFLTGEIKIGKTTLLNKALVELNLEVCGFRTIPISLDGGKKFFVLKSVNTSVQIPENAYIYNFNKYGERIPNLRTFNDFGAKILRECLKKHSKVIIMDELGTCENEASLFKNYVFQCLDAPSLVLGVIKNKESDFLKQIREREDVHIIGITVKNREEKYHILKETILGYLNIFKKSKT